MVLFCHAIATANLSDLKCLGDFVSSLQTSGETVEAAEKLRRLCHVFHRVAELYIQTKIQQQHQYQFDNSGIEQNQLNDVQYHQQQQSLTLPSASTTPLNIPPTPQPNANTDQNNTFKYTNPPPSSQFPIDDFEPYLSALGFPNAAGFLNIGQQQPPPQQQQNGLAPQMTAPATAPTDYTAENLEASLGSGDAMSLENWFNGNVNLMSLLEMDLSSIIK
jgi:hypothetical protein